MLNCFFIFIQINHTMKSTRFAGWLYLLFVPIWVSILGFGLGKISAAYYLPVWLINVLLMVLACWVVGLRAQYIQPEKKLFIAGAFFWIVPWILISMFFGLGPPPDTPAGWAGTASEQQLRYFMLSIAGIFIALGFSLLKEKLKQEGENFYSLLGVVAIQMALPLFLLDMLFWGFSLTESFKILVSSQSEKFPEWFSPIRKLFGMISVVEVALTYLATLFFSIAMYRTGWLSRTASRVYAGVSLVAFILIILSAFLPDPFITAGFAVSIPAIPFLMPYYMGIHLLKLAGKTTES